MDTYKKKATVYAEPITVENFANLELMGAVISRFNERSLDAWHEKGKDGQVVIWTELDPNNKTVIKLAQCKTIEGLHAAKLPSRLMMPVGGGTPYFCTEEIFQATYEATGQNVSISPDDFTGYIHQGSH